jgi:outer membrane protein assembly factor BamB
MTMHARSRWLVNRFQTVGVWTVVGLAAIPIFALTMLQVTAADWPQFLGPGRNGISAEKGLISQFPADGPKVVWRTPLGVSMSGVVVSDGRAYTLFQDSEKLFLVSLNAADGKVVWKTPFAAPYENAMGNGPRATPTVSNDTIVVFTGEGILAGFASKDGHELWKANVPQSLKGTASEYGMSCSPLIVENNVIIHTGSEAKSVAAFELSTGKLVWTAGSGKAGYSSPVLLTLNDQPQIVSLTATGAFGIDAENGTVLWDFPFPTEYDCNTACPVQAGSDSVLISAGENHGSVILQIAADGQSAQEVWSSLGKDSQLRAEWQTPVIHDGHLYGLDNSGSAGPITNLVCIRLKDKKTVWKKARFGKSNLILADGKLYLTTMDGEVVIVDASPTAFHETARATVMETTRQAPSIANGHLLVRDDKDVICIDIRAQ